MDYLSNWFLLTRTYVFIVKRIHRRVMIRYGPQLTGRLLDLGCGIQPFRRFLGCSSYLGIDTNIERRPGIVADVAAIPVRAGKLDSVLCTEVIEHVPDPDAVIAEIHRVLKPGGKLLLTAPMSWGLHYEPYDFWRFTPYGFKVLLERNGFTVQKTERIGGLFSMIGARVVEAHAVEVERRLRRVPRVVSHALTLTFSIPLSVFFALLGDLLDPMIHTDAIGHAVLAIKNYPADLSAAITSPAE